MACTSCKSCIEGAAHLFSKKGRAERPQLRTKSAGGQSIYFSPSDSEGDEVDDAKEEKKKREVLLESLGNLRSQATRQEIDRFFTITEIEEIQSFDEEFLEQDNNLIPRRRSSVSCSTVASSSPWGNPQHSGGDTDSWSSVDPLDFKVRGPTYGEDRLKISSSKALSRLVLVDLFEVSEDIPCVSSSSTVGAVQRARASGVTDHLIVLNFRICPLQLAVVWAVPRRRPVGTDAAQELLHQFLHTMSDEERTSRLKVIPRIAEGPWVVQKVVGSKPAILGKQVPLSYHRPRADVLEISIEVSSSGMGRRIVGVLQCAASAVVVDVAFVLEGTTPEELPEQLLGGFRIARPDVTSLRVVDVP